MDPSGYTDEQNTPTTNDTPSNTSTSQDSTPTNGTSVAPTGVYFPGPLQKIQLSSGNKYLDYTVVGAFNTLFNYSNSMVNVGLNGMAEIGRLTEPFAGIGYTMTMGGNPAQRGVGVGLVIIGNSGKVLKFVGTLGKSNKIPHKNSLNYIGETHVYRIKSSNGTFKIGESAQGVRKGDGASIRAEQQARRLQRETSKFYETKILKTFPNKAEARAYETKLIKRFRSIYGDDMLPGNKGTR